MDNATQKAQNVVSMSEYLSQSGFAAVAQVEAYWDALRAGRLLPKRSDVDPRGIEFALENAFILERIAAGIARLRVAGTHLGDLMGMEVRGMPLTTFFAPSHRRQVADALEEMFQTPATCTMNLVSPAAAGRPALEARLILLPLKSDLGDVSRALGCLVAKGDIGSAPRRFEIAGHSFDALLPGTGPVTLPAPVPQAKTDLTVSQAPQGFEAPKTEFEDAAGKKRPPYLRLVKSDDKK